MEVQAEGLQINYGDVQAVRDVSYSVESGQSLVLLGPSGCGKTTIMRALAGLETPVAGRITVGGRSLFDAERRVDVPVNRRNIGMVFQSYAVWPHKTVFENVVFPLKMQRVARAERSARVMETLEMLGLAQFAQRSASMLSGGQMQRVALARSLVMRPDVLLLDEPLSNLDARLRDRLRLELRAIQQELGLTCVYVTHDQSEAMALADEIIVMRNGEIAQQGTPQQVYAEPVTADIARFLGVNNILPLDELQRLAGDTLGSIPDQIDGSRTLPRFACFRAEDVTITDGRDSSLVILPARVTVSSFEGASVRVRADVSQESSIEVVAPPHRGVRLAIGDEVQLGVARDAIQVLAEHEPAGGR